LRLVAATLPGHAGAPPPGDYSIEHCARLAIDLARKVGAKVVVGFSMGASVALEMVASGGFAGPVVLLGISLSAQDEPAFFHAIVRLGAVLGSRLGEGSRLDDQADPRVRRTAERVAQ
jgi:pimeloyl-ACP methyl ester carboxylesterase